MSADAQRVQEHLKSVEQSHEEYLRRLRSLYDIVSPPTRVTTTTATAASTNPAASITTARPAESRTTSIVEVPSPPFRALTFASDVLPASGGRTRRLTLEAPERPTSFYPPSPRPLLPATPNPGAGVGVGAGVVFEDEISFIPLLDLRHEHSGQSGSGGSGSGSTVTSNNNKQPRAGKAALAQVCFSDDMFLAHLRDTTFSEEMSAVLEEMLRRRHEIDGASSSSLRDFAAFERESYVSSTFEAYEINDEGLATKMSVDADMHDIIKYTGDMGPFDSADGVIDAPIVWDALKNVNANADAVGRITIVQEPTPLMLAALQLTMSPYFDMSELTYHLLSDKPNNGQTHAFMQRAFERHLSPTPSRPLRRRPSTPPLATATPPPPHPPSHPHPPPPPLSTTVQLRQRSFYFVFKYYTSVGEGLEPAPWQRYEKRPSDKKLADHIDIAECSSVLALSLGGDPVKSLRMRPRRERAREGFLYDTFGAWHVLSIQSFPDDEHTVRGEEFVQQKTFFNGPYAFLDLLISEYRDAGKRNLILHEKIRKLITPTTEFMFDRRLRDKLLFEDKHFTYIRRYFWAYNTLAVINTGLAAMVAAYTNTFTPEFWTGSHPLLWPHPSPASSADAVAYRETMSQLRTELEKVVSDITAIMKRNERTRKEIENLRDQLFSGSSIKESRRAIDQGDNIQVLTMISMIFLPLTFVTSVFGITTFTIAPTDWRFAVTMVLVCVPFMAIIVMLQTNGFTFLMRRGKEGLVAMIARYRGLDSGAAAAAVRVGQDEDEEGRDPRDATRASVQTRRRKRRLVAAASGRVAAAQWRWKRPWRRGRPVGTTQGDENLESGIWKDIKTTT